MITKAELPEIIRREPSLHGEVGLWLYLLLDVIETLQKEPETRQDREDQETARRFVMDQNGTFDHIAEVLNYETEALRFKILSSAEKSKTKDGAIIFSIYQSAWDTIFC